MNFIIIFYINIITIIVKRYIIVFKNIIINITNITNVANVANIANIANIVLRGEVQSTSTLIIGLGM